MTEPLRDRGYAFGSQALGQFGPPNHDDGQMQLAGGVDLGARETMTSALTSGSPASGASTNRSV